MAKKPDINAIRKAVRCGHYSITQHARQKKAQRKVTWNEVLEVINEGEVVERLPGAKPFPKCLIMRTVRQNQPLYVSIAHDEQGDRAHIITVHWMDPLRWGDPKTRRR